MPGITPSNFIELQASSPAPACDGCAHGERLGFSFSFAYQPIIDATTGGIYAHEALVRGPAGEPAPTILSRVNKENRYRFDQACRVKAIKTAAALAMPTMLSINFMPNAIYKPEVCIRATLEAARTHGFAVDRLIFETVEGERVSDAKWLAEVLHEYQRIGFQTAIDDFGAGFAGLNLLADFQPDIVKLDMDLVRHIDQSPARRAIVRGVARICEELGIKVIGEGVETIEESACLQDLGIHLLQGYLFSKPLFEGCLRAGEAHWQSRA
ncbi:diguanylate phosphodiesterase [Rhodoferax koreense]|uniref:Diguanylate phosphodiesterase n=1 Tax=Rhodoferax koreensis TaxID=1842727 RepID=A0A1P8K0S1_9BURK|nr:EAL domain-containing protein [Rhodoferax koreense]APW39596.1 diguanylate phosphodiesterase [Rhodoferax koreense]